MSRSDELIRRDLETFTGPVGLAGVLEHVQRRKARRKLRRRVQHVLLAVAVLAGSVGTTVVLTRTFAHRAIVGPGGHPASDDGDDIICNRSDMAVDVDGDGQPDQLDVYSPGISRDGTCDHSTAGRRFVLHVSGGKLTTESPQGEPSPYPETRFYGVEAPLPECVQPRACQLFAVADLNDDGSPVIAVQSRMNGQMRSLTLYRVDVSPATPPVKHVALVKVNLAAPGDPWSGPYGLSPGRATGAVTFHWGTSPEAIRWISCADRRGVPVVVVGTAVKAPGTGYSAHLTYLRLDRDTLRVIGTSNETVSQAPSLPASLCGAPIWQRRDGPSPPP